MSHSAREILYVDGVMENPFVIKKCQIFDKRNFQKIVWEKISIIQTASCCEINRDYEPSSWGTINSEIRNVSASKVGHLRELWEVEARQLRRPSQQKALGSLLPTFFSSKKYLSACFLHNLILINPPETRLSRPNCARCEHQLEDGGRQEGWGTCCISRKAKYCQ